MACKTSYELHHYFPKLAEESGFAFNTHRPRVHIDWNKIRLIDIENLIRERKFVLVEQHLNDILDCVLESEFDVRILDEGVLKMFRLAQLTVEYQQFCRHYLDRSVFVLRQEITALAQELDVTKKNLQEKDEELRKLRKRTRHTYKTPLPYGNDNIATMILKTLSNRGDVMFPNTSDGDIPQYNKCNYCEKVFLNQLYLKSHITRRHGNAIETPQKEPQDNGQINDNTKLSSDIMELKNKLKDMETMIAKSNHQDVTNATSETMIDNTKKDGISHDIKKHMKDAEVSTNNEDYLLNKLEEWKKEEHEKYNKELNILRNQIMETVNTLKEKETRQPAQNDTKVIEQLNETIIQQGAEILSLKQEISLSKSKTDSENVEKSREMEAQISFWTKRAETQSKQYESLLQKLNEVAKDAKESRVLAETERERAAHLQALLEQSNNNKPVKSVNTSTNPIQVNNEASHDCEIKKKTVSKQSPYKTNTLADKKTLQNLHRKAQELLSIGSLSSSSSDISNSEKDMQVQSPSIEIQDFNVKKPKSLDKIQYCHNVQHQKNNAPRETSKAKEQKLNKEKLKSNGKHLKEEISSVVPGSPLKVVRAKLTEEVNSRLVSAGVDPLKSRLPKTIFQKQRTQLQQQQELKSKKNPLHEKVRHTILTLLDTSTTNINKEVSLPHGYISPSKATKPFRSLTSVISGVKSKALSLVKLNDLTTKDKHKFINANVAKRIISLLPDTMGTATSNTAIQRNSPTKVDTDSSHENHIRTRSNGSKVTKKTKKNKTTNRIPFPQKTLVNHDTNDTSDVSSESDHKYYNTDIVEQSSKSIENLIKSPARRPSSASTDFSQNIRQYTTDNVELTRTQSATNLTGLKAETNNISKYTQNKKPDDSSEDVESLTDVPLKKAISVENIQSAKQTKSVLKNASSTSSLNKKKVLFDMDAIQMKSLSASPSQSLTEKSDTNEKYELGLVDLDGEEWDISSIENEPLKNDTKIQLNTRTSPKIAELKQTIESQLSRRNETASTKIVGGVDVFGRTGPIPRAASIGGSNTSLGSSILDESEGLPGTNHKAFVKPKKVTERDDSEIEISEFSIDGIANKNESF